MVDFGAEATKDEREAIVNYLVDHFGPAGTTKVNVNMATTKEIESGLKLTSKEAEAVVQCRQQHGNFKDWHELLKIDGVDTKKIEAAQERIVL